MAFLIASLKPSVLLPRPSRKPLFSLLCNPFHFLLAGHSFFIEEHLFDALAFPLFLVEIFKPSHSLSLPRCASRGIRLLTGSMVGCSSFTRFQIREFVGEIRFRSVVQILAQDTTWDVRLAIAQRSHLPGEVLQTLAQDASVSAGVIPELFQFW